MNFGPKTVSYELTLGQAIDAAIHGAVIHKYGTPGWFRVVEGRWLRKTEALPITWEESAGPYPEPGNDWARWPFEEVVW